MSSDRFAVLIHPDPDLRRRVLGSGVLLTLIGVFLLLTTHGLTAAAKVVLSLVWLLWNGWELRRQQQGADTVERIRLAADGTVTVYGRGGRTMPATLAAGSLVLEHWAWLRLDVPGVGRHGEPLRRSRVGEAGWHRFRLVFAQRMAGFGHRGPT